MKLVVVGLNHRTAPIDVRERVSFEEDEARRLLVEIRDDSILEEAIILSTCNRTEIYAVATDDSAADASIRKLLTRRKPVDLASNPGYLHTLRQHESARHLLRVASGLDSLILGESQILGQVKRAYEQSQACGTCGVFLHRLLQIAIKTGKRVRNETQIGAGAVSVASAASELASKIYRDLSTSKVLLIGVGEMGRIAAQHMFEKGAQSIVIVNRTFAKAEALAMEMAGRAEPFDRLPECLTEADVVISCTGATEPLITASAMKPVLSQRSGRPLYIIDIAVPRDFDRRIGDLDGVLLQDMDSMSVLVDQNVNKRRSEVPRAEMIVESELESFLTWRRSLAATPTIKQLREKLDMLRKQELRRHHKRFSDADRQQLDLLTESLVKKIFHPLMQQVREWADDGALGALRVDTIYEAFELARPGSETILRGQDEASREGTTDAGSEPRSDNDDDWAVPSGTDE